MKTLPVLFGIVIVVVVTSTSFAQVKTKAAPVSWLQAALTDGEELYLEFCAVCHGKGGLGDGPAAGALTNTVPDLTTLAAENDGVFPREQVQNSIVGESRVISHGTIDMPIWGQVFEDARPDWKPLRRQALAKQRVNNLTEYLATIQAE